MIWLKNLPARSVIKSSSTSRLPSKNTRQINFFSILKSPPQSIDSPPKKMDTILSAGNEITFSLIFINSFIYLYLLISHNSRSCIWLLRSVCESPYRTINREFQYRCLRNSNICKCSSYSILVWRSIWIATLVPIYIDDRCLSLDNLAKTTYFELKQRLLSFLLIWFF